MNNDEQAIKQSLSQLSGPMVISRGGRNRGEGKKWRRRDGVKKQKERETELDNKNIESNMFRARSILLARSQINSSVIFFII